MDRLKDKLAIVTGGANGLGAAITRRLALEGAFVIVTDIDENAGNRIAEEVGGAFLLQDVVDEERWQAVVAEVENKHGALHILVNNAGIEGQFADPFEMNLDDWRAIQRVNVEGVFMGCRAAIPAIKRAGGGAIVNLSSIAGLIGTPDGMAYGASKAAVMHITKSFASYCAKNGSRIRCNSVHPGVVRTDMGNRLIADLAAKQGITIDQMEERFRSTLPAGEFLEPHDIANAVLFLASDEAAHITGLPVIVDGGMLLNTR